MQTYTVLNFSQDILEVVPYEYISSFPHFYTAALYSIVWMIP